ncbi:MAG: hypothetical protein LUF35_11265 [Lachnospiraceae bacterium]|nr:hypothetical protein [Lachnospiraceae bacterium]
MKRTAGISLMLLIFLSLCLITFSLLSLSGATADEKLSQKAADRTTEYYAAVTEANKILSEIDTQLAAAFQEAQDATDPAQTYFAACAALSVAGVDLEWSTQNSDTETAAEAEDSEASGTLSYDVSMADDQYLHMELSVTWPESGSDTLYRIVCQEVVSSQDWSADTSQNLYRSNAD